MRTAIVALTGASSSVFLARTARRRAVAVRLDTGDRRRRQVPRPLADRVDRALDAAAIDSNAADACATWASAVAVVVLLGSGTAGLAFGAAAGTAVAVAMPIAVLALRNRRDRRVAAAVPEMLERVASELRAGGTIATAITAIAADDGALAGDFARIDVRLRLGATTAEALRAWADERPVGGVDAAAGALALCLDVGGHSADALDALASSLRARLALIAEARALSAQARMSAIVVGSAPIGYLGWSAMVDRDALHALVATPVGHACLAVGLTLEAVGALWMHRIVRAGSVL
jgi:tight adherence protein B